MAAFIDSFVKSIILPKPSPSYDTGIHPGKLVHIPKVNWETRKESGAFTYGLLLLDPTSKYLVIYAHTNAVDMAMMFDELSYLSKRASVSVLLFEYTGYGISHGETTENSMNEDMLSAYCYAIRHLHVPPSRVVLMGRSIGTGPAAQVCGILQDEDEVPAFLVLQSPFTSLSECANKITSNAGSIVSLLGYDWFRTIDIIARIRCPVIIQHGDMDDVVPVEHARRLKRAIEEATPPGLVEIRVENGFKHNNLPISNTARIVDKKIRELSKERCLQIKLGAHMTANPPVYDTLFCPGDKRITTVDALLLYWNEKLELGSFAYKREKLYIQLVAGVALFAMRCAQVWQRYTESWKLHHNGKINGEGPSMHGKEDVINCCLACWGSPLGLFLSTTSAASGEPIRHKVFGAQVLVDSPFERPPLMVYTDHSTYLSVAELDFTNGLMKSIVAAVSAAPTLTEKGDSAMSVFLQKDVITRIQTECERIVAFLDDGEWENLLTLLHNFTETAPSFLSKKAFQLYKSLMESGEGRIKRKESIADFREWLKPWMESSEARQRLGGEVSWDYYLFKARLAIQDECELEPGTQWPRARQLVDDWLVAAHIHCLFKMHSLRCVHPTFT